MSRLSLSHCWLKNQLNDLNYKLGGPLLSLAHWWLNGFCSNRSRRHWGIGDITKILTLILAPDVPGNILGNILLQKIIFSRLKKIIPAKNTCNSNFQTFEQDLYIIEFGFCCNIYLVKAEVFACWGWHLSESVCFESVPLAIWQRAFEFVSSLHLSNPSFFYHPVNSLHRGIRLSCLGLLCRYNLHFHSLTGIQCTIFNAIHTCKQPTFRGNTILLLKASDPNFRYTCIHSKTNKFQQLRNQHSNTAIWK